MSCFVVVVVRSPRNASRLSGLSVSTNRRDGLMLSGTRMQETNGGEVFHEESAEVRSIGIRIWSDVVRMNC